MCRSRWGHPVTATLCPPRCCPRAPRAIEREMETRWRGRWRLEWRGIGRRLILGAREVVPEEGRHSVRSV